MQCHQYRRKHNCHDRNQRTDQNRQQIIIIRVRFVVNKIPAQPDKNNERTNTVDQRHEVFAKQLARKGIHVCFLICFRYFKSGISGGNVPAKFDFLRCFSIKKTTFTLSFEKRHACLYENIFTCPLAISEPHFSCRDSLYTFLPSCFQSGYLNERKRA